MLACMTEIGINDVNQIKFNAEVIDIEIGKNMISFSLDGHKRYTELLQPVSIDKKSWKYVTGTVALGAASVAFTRNLCALFDELFYNFPLYDRCGGMLQLLSDTCNLEFEGYKRLFKGRDYLMDVSYVGLSGVTMPDVVSKYNQVIALWKDPVKSYQGYIIRMMRRYNMFDDNTRGQFERHITDSFYLALLAVFKQLYYMKYVEFSSYDDLGVLYDELSKFIPTEVRGAVGEIINNKFILDGTGKCVYSMSDLRDKVNFVMSKVPGGRCC